MAYVEGQSVRRAGAVAKGSPLLAGRTRSSLSTAFDETSPILSSFQRDDRMP